MIGKPEVIIGFNVFKGSYRKLARQLSRTNSLAVAADYKLARSKIFLRHPCYADRHHKSAWQWGCRVAAVLGLSLFACLTTCPGLAE